MKKSTPWRLVALLLLVGACGPGGVEPEGSWAPTHDLVEESSVARVTGEFSTLDPASSDAWRHLGAGWSQGEGERRAEPPRIWGTGSGSVLEVRLFEPRDGLALQLDCAPFTFPGAPRQTVRVELNGVETSRLELEPERARYRVPLPRSRLRAGVNRVRFLYGYGRRPSEVAAGSDRRALAVAWYGIRLAPRTPATDLRVDPSTARLALPPGVEADFFLEVEPESYLAADEWTFRGAGRGRLEVLLQAEGGDQERLATLREPPRKGRVALGGTPVEGRRIVRLTLRSVGSETGAGGMVLTRPVVGTFSQEVPEAPEGTGERVPVPVPRPNVLVYLVDTLRSDHLGCYGYPRDVSPALDAFAAEALLFEQAVAQSSWTRAAVGSIFTGLWPAAHGANLRNQALSQEAVTVAELLRGGGYRTAAFVTNPNVTEELGFAQGFEEFRYLGGVEVRADEVTRAVVEWLDRYEGEEPFFLYVHTIDPHSPYDPPPAFREAFAPGVPAEVVHQPNRLLPDLRAGRLEMEPGLLDEMVALYDAEIAANDAAFAELRGALEERGLYTDLVLMVLSDHGEEFYEHGSFEHGKTLFEESLRVPLLLKLGADGPRGRVAEPVQHLDVLPTLLHTAGVPVPDGLPGRSLLRAPRPAPVYSYLHLDGRPRASVRADGWKMLQRLDPRGWTHPRLFHLARDPGETEELSSELPVRAGYLTSLILRRLQDPRQRLEAPRVAIDAEMRRQLEALGYL